MLWLPWIWSTRLQRRRFPGRHCSICDRWCGTQGVRSVTMLPEDVEGVWDTIDFGLTGCSSGDYCGRFGDCALVMLARARKLPQALNIYIHEHWMGMQANKMFSFIFIFPALFYQLYTTLTRSRNSTVKDYGSVASKLFPKHTTSPDMI